MNNNKTPQAHEQKYGNFIHTNPPFPTPSSHQASSSTSLTKISPILILVIILLAVIFFIAGLVHLLLRFFIKRPIISSPIFHSNRFPENSLALQRQLRQLFRLHDSGLDQPSIDALPIFRYMDVIAPKQPFDCAICLAEFSQTDLLRLLPPCSHAFHAACIDAWLLSNSSCPLCRHVILASELPMLNFFDDQYFEASGGQGDQANGLRDRVFSIRLGKFSSSNESEAETSRCNMDARRCYSMGTCRYVVGEEDLRVALRCEGNEDKVVGDGKKISTRQKGESFSVSKIWLWSKNGRFPSCSDTDIRLPNSLGASFRGISLNHSSQMV